MTSIDLFLSRLSSYRETTPDPKFKRQFLGRCPNGAAHKNGDSNGSLSVAETHGGKVLLTCFRGCGFPEIIAAAGVKAEDLRGFTDPADMKGVTVIRIAETKRLPYDFLTNDCRLTDHKTNDGAPYVRIHYLDINGQEVCYRNRTRLRAKDGTYHQRGKPLYPYGIWRVPQYLKDKAEVLHLVEGESNSWALWRHGHAAIGIPGGSSVRAALGAVVSDMVLWAGTIYLWRDPDDTGTKFVADCAAKLAALQFAGRILVAAPADCKDVADLHRADPDEFPAALARVLDVAVPPRPVAAPPTETPLFPAATEPWPAGYRLDWVGLAQRLARRYRNQCRRDITSRQFMCWNEDKNKWQPDPEASRARNLVDDTISSLADEAASVQGADAESADLREEILRFRDLTRRNSSWDAGVLNALGMSTLLAVQTTDFDFDPMRLNCQNGVLDLKTGILSPPDPELLCSSVCGTRFDAKATCPRWERFLATVTNNDRQLIEYLQVKVGYTLTGLTGRQEMYFLFGTGANGKTSFIDAVTTLLGDYHLQVDSSIIVSHQQNISDNNILAQKALMHGKRMVSSTELPAGKVFNEAIVKDFADSSQLLGCHKYGKPFSFWTSHKLWIFGNHRPNVRGDDEGIWRRLWPVPFSVFIPPEQRDEGLKEALRAELPGILNWALRGLKMHLEGYNLVPDVIAREKRTYRENNDILLEFLRQECVFDLDDHSLQVAQSTLYDRYSNWAKTNGGYEIGRNNFYARIEGKRFTRSEVDKVITFHGIRLKTTGERTTRRDVVKDTKPLDAGHMAWNDFNND
jgi:P4 family phage/plasmid primase-like protien